jgi:DNA invertase Pin-like site-specific DNA recombinase
MTRAALYLRVSTLNQNTDNQELQLREVAVRAGYEITRVYRDHGISGAKGRDQRPQFDALCKDAARRRIDLNMSWSVDRLGRSLTDLLEFLKEIHALRIDLYLHQQGLDTTTPSGKAMFQMMGVFAELERSLIRERVRAGLARAKASVRRTAGPSPSRRRRGEQDSGATWSGRRDRSDREDRRLRNGCGAENQIGDVRPIGDSSQCLSRFGLIPRVSTMSQQRTPVLRTEERIIGIARR